MKHAPLHRYLTANRRLATPNANKSIATTATWILLALVSGSEAFAQVTSGQPSDGTPSSGGFFTLGAGSEPLVGFSRSVVKFEGLLARSDGETLSIELPDQRVIRFQLNEHTLFTPDGPPGRLSAFRITDVVSVEAAAESKGYFLARNVRFVRKPSAAEQAEVLQCPESSYRSENNVIDNAAVDPKQDSRKLNLMAKPAPLLETGEPKPTPGAVGDDLIPSIRRRVNEAFERLPTFRARQVTSMFHSTDKKVKWVPNGVIAAEVAYEGEQETYSEIQVDGKRPANAPLTGDSEYMRSFNNAWSTGDFETLAHCVFAGLEDSDFHKAATEHGDQGDLAVYEFAGGRASTCVAVRSQSQIAYPSYRGSFKVKPQTQEVVHVELEATDMPKAFPLDRAERSVDFGAVHIGPEQYLLPTTGYWFGCYRNSYNCFLNRVDFHDYRHFSSNSVIRFAGN
ncbi:MAG: hypothetical protein ABSG13_04845 [Bryobacteraceae bacterium]|jgi:hypothetical protein